MEMRLAEVAAHVGGDLSGDGEILIKGVAGIKEAGSGEITFLGDSRYEEWLAKTTASAVIVPRDHPYNGRACVRVDDPHLAFYALASLFHRASRPIPPGIHPSALLGADVRMGAEISIGPNVIVGDRCAIGDRTMLLPGVVIGHNVMIGDDCLIYPNAVLREDTQLGHRVIIHAGAVIGDDGFGFRTSDGQHEKVPQLGRVVIEDDVEIGANTCIDRATAGETVIRCGSRIDNLVQVAHNVKIGSNSILCAQVGIAGSTSVGDSVTLAGQVGIIGHISIGDRAMVGAQGGVTKSIPPDGRVSGYPATPHHLAKRIYAAQRRLPDLVKNVRRLEKRVKELEERGDSGA